LKKSPNFSFLLSVGATAQLYRASPFLAQRSKAGEADEPLLRPYKKRIFMPSAV
jgi:hypothetical protein